MADCCFAQDAPGKVLFTILDVLDIAVGMMAAFSVEEVSSVAVVGQTLRMDPEPLRREIRRQNRILQTQGMRIHSWQIDTRRGDLVEAVQDR